MKKLLSSLLFLILNYISFATFAQQNIIGGNTIQIKAAPYQVSLVEYPGPPGGASKQYKCDIRSMDFNCSPLYAGSLYLSRFITFY